MIAEVASAMLLKQFFTWMSGLSGGFGKIGSALLAGMGKANGGPVMGNRAYMVGERGPEMFVPSSGGSIVPNNRMGGGVTVAPVYNVDARGASADLVKALPAILEANTRRAVELARATIYDDYSRGAFGRA
jgi:phage-related minor tail protein